jgi:hypothetical protein
MARSFRPVWLSVVMLAVIAAVLVPGGPAWAGVPCAGTSEGIATPDRGAYSPAGGTKFLTMSIMDTMTVTANVRDCYGAPLPGRWVVVDPIIVNSGHCFCHDEAPESCLTDINGTCSVTFSHFGGCDTKSGDGGDCGLQFSVVSEGVELGPTNRVTTASPDTDADCDVDLQDFIFFASVYLGDEWCVDFDSDGDVDLQDFITFAGHYLDVCPPTQPD